MHTYRITFTIANQPGRRVEFRQSTCADFAGLSLREAYGGWGKCTIWEVEQVD
jgi:hypothetical protein